MFLKYGSYTHAENEGAMSIFRSAKANDRGQTESVIERWEINGVLQAASVAALTTAIQALEAAYGTDGQDIVLLDTNGITETAHKIDSSLSTSGVRVIELGYPNGTGGEYTTYRGYRIVVEAETQVIPTGGQSNTLVNYQEAISYVGGGPKFGWMQTLRGPPVLQLLAEQTPFRAVQTGSAVGKKSYPVPNYPVWPQAEHEDRRQIVRRAPERKGDDFVDYEVQWTYEFSDASALSGLPKVR